MRTKNRSNANTPNNYVSVLDYGVIVEPTLELARTTGSQSVAIQRAFDDIADGSVLLFPPGHYVLNETVVTDKSLSIEATGAKFFINSPVSGFRFDCTQKAQCISLTGDGYSPGDKVINIAKLDDEGNSYTFGTNQLFKIVSKVVDGGNRDSGSNDSQYRSGEWAYALSIATGDDQNTINLTNPLRFTKGVSWFSRDDEEKYISSYKTSHNQGGTNYNNHPKVIIIPEVTLSWNGGEIEFEKGHDDEENASGSIIWRQGCINILGYTKPTVNSLDINYGYGPGIVIDGCTHAKVTNCIIQNLKDRTSRGNYGYGVVEGGTIKGNVSQCTFINTRHGYTTGANSYTWRVKGEPDSDGQLSTVDEEGLNEDGTPVNPYYKLNRLQGGKTQSSIIADCHGSNQFATPFDTHMDAEDIIFNNCIVENGDAGFSVRGRGIILNNCKAMNIRRGYLIFTEFAKQVVVDEDGDSITDPDDDLFTASKPFGATTCAMINCIAECVTDPTVYNESNKVTYDGRPAEPIKVGAVRTLFMNNVSLKSNSHQMVLNNGSRILFSGFHNYVITDYDGRVPIVHQPMHSRRSSDSRPRYRVGVFEQNANSTNIYIEPGQKRPYWDCSLIFTDNCTVNIDASKALRLKVIKNADEAPDLDGEGDNLYLFRSNANTVTLDDPENPGSNISVKLETYMKLDGAINATISNKSFDGKPVFSSLLTSYGWLRGTGNQQGKLTYSIVSDFEGDVKPPDNDENVKLALFGHTINAESVDKSIIYQAGGEKPNSYYAARTVTATIPEGETQVGLRPDVTCSYMMDKAGQYIKQLIKLEKVVGSNSLQLSLCCGDGSAATSEFGSTTFNGTYAELEVCTYIKGPTASGISDINEACVYAKYTDANGTKLFQKEDIKTQFKRYYSGITEIFMTGSAGDEVKAASPKVEANYNGSARLFTEFYCNQQISSNPPTYRACPLPGFPGSADSVDLDQPALEGMTIRDFLAAGYRLIEGSLVTTYNVEDVITNEEEGY